MGGGGGGGSPGSSSYPSHGVSSDNATGTFSSTSNNHHNHNSSHHHYLHNHRRTSRNHRSSLSGGGGSGGGTGTGTGTGTYYPGVGGGGGNNGAAAAIPPPPPMIPDFVPAFQCNNNNNNDGSLEDLIELRRQQEREALEQFIVNRQVSNLQQVNNAVACIAAPPLAAASAAATSNNLATVSDVFNNLKKLEDPSEILLARAEGLHAHGHVQEASRLAVHLAEELLSNPPNLMLDLPQYSKNKRKKVHPASHLVTCLASSTLGKCAFLCSVLADHPSHTHLAFNLALFALEMPRQPASTKPLEVKLAHQEFELVNQLKRMSLGVLELTLIREKAKQLSTGSLRSRGQALLPLMLAAFVFDALVVTPSSTAQFSGGEALGFQAAVAALGMKANVSEAEHPLLCEGTRKQRGELALTLLTHYKDDQTRLVTIMDKFLDKEVHQMHKQTQYTAAHHHQVREGRRWYR